MAPWAVSQRSASAVDGVDLLPDLAMARPTDLKVQTIAGGRRLLRFTTMIVNIGTGPLEVRASRRSTSVAGMHVKQRIYDAAGGYRVVTTPSVAGYSGDGHEHWHVQGVAAYELLAVSEMGGPVARSSKVGFCFFDTRPYRLTLPGAPATARYAERGCGDRRALAIRLGISVGWADRYASALRFQAIDVSALAPGEYLLKVTADPGGAFVEAQEHNNCNWTRLRIRGSSSTVSTHGWGAGCNLPGPAPSPSTGPPATPGPIPSPTPTSTATPSIPAVTTALDHRRTR